MPPEELSKQIQDTLVTNEKVREGLDVDDALPFMDWGSAYADVLAERLAAPETPEPNEEQVNETAYALARLMMRINWLVTYRDKKDAAWLTQTFQMVNKLSRDLLGDAAPVFADDEIAAWLAEHSAHTNRYLLQNFMARLSPPALAAPDVEPPSSPPDSPTAEETPLEPESPARPLSNWVFGAPSPGRSDSGAASHEPDVPLQPGEDEYDETKQQ
jgi:hypothetical protein